MWNTIPGSLIFIAIDMETFKPFCGALLIWTDDFETLSLILAIVVATVAPAPPACLDLLVCSSIDQYSPLLQSFGHCVLNATAAATFQPPSKCVLMYTSGLEVDLPKTRNLAGPVGSMSLLYLEWSVSALLVYRPKGRYIKLVNSRSIPVFLNSQTTKSITTTITPH